MKSFLVIIAVFLLGLLIGREVWPDAHPDPAYHLRFHRGKIPATAQEKTGLAVYGSQRVKHPRALNDHQLHQQE